MGTSAQNKKYYFTWRRFIIQLLGGKCSNPKCGTTVNLEIHHIDGNNPVNKTKDKGSHLRVQDWRVQYFEGNLQLLCKKCNLERRG